MPTPKTKAPAETPVASATSPLVTVPPKNGKRNRSPAKKVEEREVIYPRYEVLICCCPVPDAITGEMVEYDGPITIETAKKLLKWETEDEYVKRELARDPDQKESKLRFGTEYMLKDRHGNKVRCWNSDRNRPFDETHARKLAQDTLTLNFEMNGEDIIISRTGQVNSGNHRLIGLVLAGEQWEMNDKWKENWSEEPYLESAVFLGASDDPKVIQTIDNVKPRTLADVFYTSPLFINKTQGERKECSRMLDYAVDLLWNRLKGKHGFIDHQTHSASLDFFERHKKLLACVKHIHDEDSSTEGGRAISNLQLNTGHCAALLFLMGQSMTPQEDADEYHTAGGDRTEKKCNWKLWDRALEFWSEIAKDVDAAEKKDRPPEWVQTVKDALAGLNDPNMLKGASTKEQHSVIALAWAHFADGIKDFTAGDITPEFVVDKVNNTRTMADPPTFGGIDMGVEKDEPPQKDPTPEEIEAGKKEQQMLRAEKLKADAAKAKEEADKKNAPLPMRADTAKKVPAPKTERATGSLNPAKTPPKNDKK